MKRSFLALVVSCIATLATIGGHVSALAQTYNVYDPSLPVTLAAMLRNRTAPTPSFTQLDSAQVIVASHRGLFDATHPENTIPAMLNAVNANIEAMELDVYESSDGVPYLMHDQTLKRMVLDDRYSDIHRWQREGASLALKPPTWAEISQMKVCENPYNGHGVTVDSLNCDTSANVPVPSLIQGLQALYTQGYQGLVFLDLRETGDIVDTVAALVNNYDSHVDVGFSNWLTYHVVAKFQTTLFAGPSDYGNQVLAKLQTTYGSYDDIERILYAIYVQPVYTSNSVAKLETSVDPQWAVHDYATWQGYFNEYLTGWALLPPLVGLKAPLAVLNTPQDDIFTTVWEQGGAVGVYVPVQECTNPNPSTAASNISGSAGVYIEGGFCGPITPPMTSAECGAASTSVFDTQSQGCADHRPFYLYWHDVAKFGFIITDDPAESINALAFSGQRPGSANTITPVLTDPGVSPGVILAADLGNSPVSACATVSAASLDAHGLNTTAIQTAITNCALSSKGTSGTRYVELSGASGYSFTSGALYLASNVSLWIDAGVTLNASTNPSFFQRSATSGTVSCYPPAVIPPCGTLNGSSTSGCDALINACRVANSGVYGSGTLEGHGWDTINDGHSSVGVTWWARSATSKAGGYAVSLSAPEMIQFMNSKQVSIQGVTVQNAPRYEITLNDVNGATISNVTIHTPTPDHASQGPAYNTDGIDPVSSQNVQILNVAIISGDDNIAIKTSDGPSSNIAITNANLYGPGHGLSIGSQTNGGISHVTATNINMIGTVNGLRIKSSSDRGGVVSNIKYDHVCMLGVKNPIDIDPAYKNGGTGSLYPNFQSVELDNVYANGGTVLMNGYSISLPLNIVLNNVVIGGLGSKAAANANISELYDPSFPATITVPSDIGGSVTQSTVGADIVSGGIQAYCNANNVRHPTGVLVDQAGLGNFTTIQAAVTAAPADGSNIYINPGTYHEIVTVTAPFIHLIGTGTDPSQVVVTYNNSGGTLDATGVALGTSKSATVFAKGDDFLARNLTIKNTFDIENGQDAVGSQAVALYASGDRGVYRNLNIIGRQDTLYVNNKGCDTTTTICQPSRQYFADSYIEGNVDYVFGAGRAFFDTCQFHSVMHDYPSGEDTITAQSREYANEDSGYVFSNSYFTQDAGLTNVWLGRPWKPYSTVILLNTDITSPVVPAGYQEWIPGTTNYLWTAWYGEYNSYGPGATGPREPWMQEFNSTQAGWYSFAGYMAWPDNWDPSTTW